MTLKPFKRLAAFLVITLICQGPTSAKAQEAIYRLDAGDRVRVTVFGHEDLSGNFEVDGAGRLSLPLIQHVRAAGSTLAELEEAITNKLKPDFLKNPRVSVEVLNYRPFYILGEVKNPGSYPYVNGMAVINAVALAPTGRGGGRRGRSNRLDGNRLHQKPNRMAISKDLTGMPEKFEAGAGSAWKKWFDRNAKHFPSRLGKLKLETSGE